MSLWGCKWISDSRLSGHCEHLLWDGRLPLLFPTRREARAYIKQRYGYIATRKDLRSPPHCWKMPRAVRVTVSVASRAGEG